ncbi:MAG: hypothetical protein LBC43_00555 [Bifidobacteriaceae bacterium]|jgi:hypothetical protein|nr:hypothetical protein [Bifidobacteriaceae bacterium]
MKKLFFFALGVGVGTYLIAKNWETVQKRIPEPVASWTNDRVRQATETYNEQLKPYVDENITPLVNRTVEQIKVTANQGIVQVTEAFDKLGIPKVEVKVTPPQNPVAKKATKSGSKTNKSATEAS